MTRARISQLLPTAIEPVADLGIRLPTPLDERPDIGTALGLRFYLKREDLIDDIGTGHKSRKLAYVVADARERGANVLVTAGSLPSGQCVAVAALARRLGVRAHLVYCGDSQVKPAQPNGNYLLALLFDPTISWHERRPWADVAELLTNAGRAEAADGMRPYLIPPGLDTWPGILGSIDLGLELAAQLANTPDAAKVTHVVAPAGSGTTCLGLSIAAALLDLPWTVHGMCIGGTAAGVRNNITRLRADVIGHLGDCRPQRAEVTVHGESLGAGYDRPTDAELTTVRQVLQRFLLPLDPNYMVKTYRGILQGLETGTFADGDRVVLVHTGGNVGLFGGTRAMRNWFMRNGVAVHLAADATP